MAQKFLTDIEVTQGLIDSSGDLGVAGQVLSSTGSGTNWITNEANSTVVYLDELTGDNSTVDFTLSVSVTDENITQVYIDGVYQNKDTYSVGGTTLTFSTAPPLNADIEVITFSTATTSDDLAAGSVIIPVKNTHTASIAKGEPVYITGNVGASARLEIAPADASNSAKMPAAGLLLQTLAVNAEGYVITGGYLRNITTDTIDGTSTSSNDTVYVKSGGGLTMTKPTGTNLIQNIAKVARSSGGSSGSLLVSSILRTNDVPNLTTGKIWVGSANNTIESGTLHLDESNNRLGIGTTSPDYNLEIESASSPAIATKDTTNNVITKMFSANSQGFVGTESNHDLRIRTNNTDKITIQSGGNVGIGTTNPQEELHLASSLPSIRLEDTDNNIYHTIRGNESHLIIAADAGNTGGSSSIRFQVDTDEKMRIDSSGRVGIGTTDIEETLTIAKHDGGDGTIVGLRSDASFSQFELVTKDSQVSWGLQTIGARNMYFTTNGSERMRIDSSGNVGIGETSPNDGDLTINAPKLHVVGPSTAGTYNLVARFQAGNDSDNTGSAILINHSNDRGLLIKAGRKDGDREVAYFDVVSSGANVTNVLTMGKFGSDYNVGIGTTTPSAKLNVIDGNSTFVTSDTNTYPRLTVAGGSVQLGLFRSSSNVGGGYIGADGSTCFHVRDASFATKLYLTQGGNLGIGTTSPSTLLHILGNSNSSDNILTLTNTKYGSTNTTGETGIIFGWSNHIAARITAFKEGTVNRTGFKIIGEAGFNVPTTIATFRSTGNVGIGNTNPLAKLQITSGDSGASSPWSNADELILESSGNAGLAFQTPNTGAATIAFQDPESVQAGFIQYLHADNALRFATNGNNERMRIDSSGNLGIGTTSPSTKLHIEGASIGYLQTIKNTTAGGDYLQMLAETGDAVFEFDSGGTGGEATLNMYRDGTQYVKISADAGVNNYFNNGANVGIGLANPSWQLEVQNTGTVRHAISSTNNGTAGVFFRVFNSGTQVGNGTIRTDNGGNMSFWTGTSGESEKMLIDSAGNVGIGTSSPQRELHLHTSSSGGSFIAFTNDTTGQTSTDGAIVGIDSSEDLRILQYENKPIRFSTNGSERMRIDSSGNVGIGITSPNTTLHVDAGQNGGNLTNNVAACIGGGFVTNDLYHREGGLLLISGTNATQTSAGIAFQTRNTGNTNYWKSSILMNRGGELEFYTGGAGTGQGTRRLLIQSDGSLKVPSVHSQTTGIGANVVVLSDGELLRSTSSLKYKTDVRDYDKGLNEVMQLQPKYYKGKNDESETQFAGLIAEDVHDLGLTEFVQYADDGTPDALSYTNMIALLTKSIQELKAEIETLKAQINN